MMKHTNESLVPWTATSLAAAIVTAVFCCAAAMALEERGKWAGLGGFELVVSALAGGAVLWLRHRKAAAMILFVFVPLTVILLFVGAVAVTIARGRLDL